MFYQAVLVFAVPIATDANVIINVIKRHRSCDLARSFGEDNRVFVFFYKLIISYCLQGSFFFFYCRKTIEGVFLYYWLGSHVICDVWGGWWWRCASRFRDNNNLKNYTPLATLSPTKASTRMTPTWRFCLLSDIKLIKPHQHLRLPLLL